MRAEGPEFLVRVANFELGVFLAGLCVWLNSELSAPRNVLLHFRALLADFGLFLAGQFLGGGSGGVGLSLVPWTQWLSSGVLGVEHPVGRRGGRGWRPARWAAIVGHHTGGTITLW